MSISRAAIGIVLAGISIASSAEPSYIELSFDDDRNWTKPWGHVRVFAKVYDDNGDTLAEVVEWTHRGVGKIGWTRGNLCVFEGMRGEGNAVITATLGSVSGATAVVVWRETSPELTVIPDVGTSPVVPGEKLTIQWRAAPSVNSVVLQFSDGGEEWVDIVTDGSIGRLDEEWNNFEWEVPLTWAGKPLSTENAMIRIYDYNDNTRNKVSETFTIQQASAGARTPATGWAIPSRHSTGSSRIFRLNGSLAGRQTGARTRVGRGSGIYIFERSARRIEANMQVLDER